MNSDAIFDLISTFTMQKLLDELPKGMPSGCSPFEELIRKVGGQGKYQKRSFFIFCVMWFLTSCLLLGMNFFFDDAFTCVDPAYSNAEKCQIYVCSLPVEARAQAIDQYAPSIIFQFDTYLICHENRNTVSLLEDMMFIGSLLGFFIIPFIADNFGTRLALRIAWGTGTVSVLLACLAPNPYILAFSLFLIGFGANPSITLCFSIINQTCLGRSRQRFAVGIQIAWAIGEIVIALVFLSSISWKGVMYIIFALFIGGSLAVEFLLFQSPMFMLKKQPQKALKILNKMASINRREQLTTSDLQTVSSNENGDFNSQNPSLGFTDLFRYKSIRMTSVAAGMIFFGVQVIYYSSVLGVDTIGFSKNINQVVFGVSQMVGYVVCQLIVHKIYRKKACYIGMGLTTLFCLIMGIMLMLQSDNNRHILSWLQIIVLICTSFSVCCFESIIYVYAAQLYPTEIRSIGFGWISVVGIMGSIVAPFAKTIASSVALNSWFVPAALGLLAWTFSFCLPETYGKPFQDSIEERLSCQMEELKSDKDDSESTQSGRQSQKELKNPLVWNELAQLVKSEYGPI